MSSTLHPAAPHHPPGFITAPGETDSFFVGAAIFLVAAIIALGSRYFRLHALPEKLAHRNASKLQFEVVGVLALLALFTHNNWLWVAALILALVPVPDLHRPLADMAESLGRMASRRAPRMRDRPDGEEAPARDPAEDRQDNAPGVVAPAKEDPAKQEPQSQTPAPVMTANSAVSE